MLARCFRSLALTMFVVLALIVVPTSSARVPIAHATGKCSYGNGRSYGYSYLTFLWVFRTSCANGRTIAHKHGHVRGWRCTKKILDRAPVQYDAQVTCKSGSRQVQWKFTQNT
jgi:hypothetical protein